MRNTKKVKKIKGEMIERRLCAQEVYTWLKVLRNSILISIVFMIILSAFGEPLLTFPVAIFAIVYLIVILKRAMSMMRYLESNYDLKGRMKI